MPDSCYSRNPDVVVAEVDGAPVLLHLGTFAHVRLNAVGQQIWTLLEQPMTAPVLVQQLASTYNAAPDAIFDDIAPFLHGMVQSGLVSAA